MIRLYCVGIYFRKEITFQNDVTVNGVHYMYGSSILKKASDLGLRYQVNSGGHLEYLSYTPQPGDTFAHFPGINAVTPQPPPVFPNPAAFPPSASPNNALRAFPFYGQPLSLFENPQPIGQLSQILQFTADPNKIDIGSEPGTTPTTTGNNQYGAPQFYFTGFPDASEIRTRLISIYVSQAPTY